MNIYTKIGNIIEKNFMWIIGFGATICLLIANIAVVSRLAHFSVSWSDEVIKIIFIYVIYIGTALAYRSDSLIGITMFEEFLIGKANNIPYKIVKIIQHLVSTGFAIFCSVQGYNMMMGQLRNGELTPALELPAAISTIGFLIGAIIWTYYGFGKIVEYIKIKEVQKPEF